MSDTPLTRRVLGKGVDVIGACIAECQCAAVGFISGTGLAALADLIAARVTFRFRIRVGQRCDDCALRRGSDAVCAGGSEIVGLEVSTEETV